MPLQIPPEMVGRRIHNALFQAHHVHFLGHHVDHNIRRRALFHIVKPFDHIAVLQRRYAYRPAFIVDLRVVIRYLKLRHHIHKFAHFSVAQLHGAVPVQHGDLIKINLLYLFGKVPRLHIQHALIPRGVKQLGGTDPADQCRQRHDRSRADHCPFGRADFKAALKRKPPFEYIPQITQAGKDQ